MDPKAITVERRLGALAGRAHGLVTRAQALEAGISADQLNHRVRTGALLRAHRGVYRVGHRAPSYEARYLAAVLACGRDALLSGPAAAHLHGLLTGAPPPPEVTTRTVRRVRGVRTRRCPRLDERDATRVRGIPVTTIERTLVDIAGVLSFDDLARACHEAGVRYGTTPARVDATLARRRNAPGTHGLRAILRGEAHVSLSRLERRFLNLLREVGLLLPETNRPAGSRRVDCRWPDQRLTVELDSYTYHASRHSWEQDRRREREARARGDDFRRYTWGDVFDRPQVVVAELRPLLPPSRGRFRGQEARKSSWSRRKAGPR